ncbi:hypothetical protein GQ457_12G025340 [Hibiscus cannabinus]
MLTNQFIDISERNGGSDDQYDQSVLRLTVVETWLLFGEVLAIPPCVMKCMFSSARVLSLLSSGRTTRPRSGLSLRLNSEHLRANLAKAKVSAIGQSGTAGSSTPAKNVPAVAVIRYCVTESETDGGTSLANPTSLILQTQLWSSRILAGLRSRCTMGSGLAWCKKRRPVAMSAAIRNLTCHGSTGVLSRLNRRSSKLP